MRKDEYLGDQIVKQFINWLAKKIDVKGSFKHIYYDRKRKVLWSCDCLKSAYQNYNWYGPLKSNQEIIDKNSKALRRSIVDDNEGEILRVCNDIFIWGGVDKGRAGRTNPEWLINNSNQVINDLKSIQLKQLLNLDEYDTNDQRLRQVKINSGFSKIYSHIIKDFIIYDGRVGAALGLFVRLYCEENNLKNIPPVLNFAFSQGRAKWRNPGSNIYKFPTLADDNHLDNNIRASWLLKKLLDEHESYFDHIGLGKLRALEAALFMIGYDVRGVKGTDDHEKRHKYLIELRENWSLQTEPEENQNIILLHRELLQYEPENIKYKYSLAKILVNIASSIKERDRNYAEARELLHESVQLQPNNIRSRYYLGILAAIEAKWREVSRYLDFDIALSILSREEKIRAFFAKAVYYSSCGLRSESDQALQQAEQLCESVSCVEIYSARAMILDQANRLNNEKMQRVIMPVETLRRPNNFSHESQLILITESDQKLIMEAEVDKIYDSNEDCALLDMRPEASFSYSRSSRPHSCRFTKLPSEEYVQLQSTEAELLALLMLNGKPLSSNYILGNLWPDSNNNALVKKYIAGIRKKLRKFYPENINEILKCSRGAYVWEDQSYKIITIPGLYRNLK